MAWYTVEEYAKLSGITIQGVYKRIKNDKVNTMKSSSGQILVEKDSEHPNLHILTGETTDLNESAMLSQIEAIKVFFENIIEEIKKSKESEINTLNFSIQEIKAQVEKVEKLKDSQIEDQKTEIQRLREEIEKLKNEKPGFFKRLFGG